MKSPSAYERLSAQDSTFLYAETADAPMHVGMLAVLQGGEVSEQSLCRHIASRLHLAPPLRKKLAFVPFEQGHPVWVDDEHFDIRMHIRTVSLPGTADDQEARLLHRHLSVCAAIWHHTAGGSRGVL